MSDVVLLDIHEVARRLSVSARHVATLEKRGEIPRAIRIGRCLRWDPRSIDEYVRGGGRFGDPPPSLVAGVN